jgi:hypothetical protein
MTTSRIPASEAQNLRRETRSYPARGTYPAGSYEVEIAEFPITINGTTKVLTFTRIAGDATKSEPGRAHNWVSGRVVTVRVGRGTKTYAVPAVLIDISHREPGMLALAGFNALNRQAYPVGFAEDLDETNVRSGYGA